MSLGNRKVLTSLWQLTTVDITIDGEVVSVDKIDWTCLVRLATGELLEARLKTLKQQPKGAVIVPAIGSSVQLLSIGGDELLVISVEIIDQIYVDADTEIIINGGANGGLVKVEPTTQKFNTLEQDINTLKNVLRAWTPVSGDGGAALKTAVSAWAANSLGNTARGDIENEKIKH